MLILRFDGLFKAVPGSAHVRTQAGFMGYGWLIFRSQAMIARGHGVFARAKDATSNVAEYLALIEGLEALLDLGVAAEPVLVSGDAKCVIDQMRGAAAVNSERIRPLYRRAQRLAEQIETVDWSWTPRRHNHEADELTRRAIRQIRSNPQEYDAYVRAIDPVHNQHASKKFLPVLDLRVYQPA